ncbi:MAG: hybrid sensor histidine kinase/response regulator [Symploca sp. SIO2E6]|nr:hybrid sensor histidine kinase/response regulator [Symploca sp. SIO2E6]
MTQDKELEIKLQFLEEAQDYLDTIESVLLGLESSHIDPIQMDAVLRAAHSVKGGAGMMGFGTLSQLAHRLEDSFKVLKAQRNSLNISEELESLLLTAVDRLRQVLTLNRQETDVDEQWLTSVGNPVFEELHECLGDPVADDASTMLGTEEGTNVAALLFETEVEGCLNRLEGVLADPQTPCLEEELSIMAQELGGLGEMLQLEAFKSLCESIIQRILDAPLQLQETAELALQAWRRSQALVLVGQIREMPTQLEGDCVPSSTLLTQPASLPTPTLGEHSITVEENDTEDVFTAEFDVAAEFDAAAEFDMAPEFDAAPEELAVASLQDNNVIEEPIAVSSSSTSVSQEVTSESKEAPNRIAPVECRDAPWHVSTGATEVQTKDVKWQENKPRRAPSTQNKETQENTVRIPVRQLDSLNDLFGELTIERNGMSLNLGRLHNMIETLSHRVSILEQLNMRLRTTYDQVATQGTAREALVGTDLVFTASINSRKEKEESFGREESKNPPIPPAYSATNPLGTTNLHPLDLSGFDTLEMDQYSDLHLLSMEVMETIVQIQEVTSDIALGLEDTDSTARELNRTTKQLQTNLTRLRMRPLSELVGRFTRALRDLSLQHGKQVELKVLGNGTLIDRSILEALNDPLMHLVRNAFDHGIEDPTTRQAQGKSPKGTIEIKAAHRGNQTLITISDDGNGINLDKIRERAKAMGLDAELLAAASEDELLSLIFEPGFSTADQVTDLSGRGVGMDVVRNNLKEIRGDIRVDTTPGQGTTFTLTVPFTLSVARVLLVESNGMLLAFTTDVIEEMLLLRSDMVLTTPGSKFLSWEGEMIPLTHLATFLKFYCPRRVTVSEGVPSISEPTVLMISQGDHLQGIQVDRCWGEQEVAVRQVEEPLVMPPGFTSCTILGDGKVVPLVDVSELLRWIASCDGEAGRGSVQQTSSTLYSQPSYSRSEGTASWDNPPALVIDGSQKDTILVVDDSINVRRFLALALEKAGYLVEQAKDGQDAVEKLLGGLLVGAVICDIEMPRLDGYGFLARIKSDPNFKDLPIAMLTSRSGDKHRQLAMTLGATAYFSKPYNERQLLRTLKQLIK